MVRKISKTIGLSPKQLSKTIRLQTTLKTLLNQKKSKLTDLAYENEYFDQSHFIKDFKEFTGISPKEFYGDDLRISSTQTVNNLTDGEYTIKTQTFNPYCYEEYKVNITSGLNCANQGGDSDGDGICDNEDGTGSDDCGAITVYYGDDTILMNGQIGKNYFFKVHDLNNGWVEVFSCAYACGNSQTVTNLANGNYLIRVYNESWEIICEQEIILGEVSSRGTMTNLEIFTIYPNPCLLYTSPSPRDRTRSRMPSSA